MHRLLYLVLALGLLAGCTFAGGHETHRDLGPPPPTRAVLQAQVTALRTQLALVDRHMQAITVAPDLDAAHAEAQAVINLTAGPDGRHFSARAAGKPDAGILPPERSPGTGLALGAYRSAQALSPDPSVAPVLAAVADTILGSARAWQQIPARYDEIDQAVRNYRPDHNTIATLDGHTMRSLAWALRVLGSQTLAEAQGYAAHGTIHTTASLTAAAQAEAALQAK